MIGQPKRGAASRRGRPRKTIAAEAEHSSPAPSAIKLSQPANGKQIPGLTRQVLDELQRNHQPVQVRDLAAKLGRDPAYVSQVCSKLLAEGQVTLVKRGVYRAA